MQERPRQTGPQVTKLAAMSSRAAVCALVLAAACAPSPAVRPPAEPRPGSLVDASGAPVSDEAFVAAARRALYVLLGESHASECDHRVQARLVRALGDTGPWVLGLEMVASDRQEVLDRFNAGELDVAALGEALDWPRTWGVDFAFYAPVLEAASAQRWPVWALNAPRRAVDAARAGTLDRLEDPTRGGFVGVLVPPGEAQMEALRQAFDAHAGHLPPGRDPVKAWEAFVRVQALWDTQMAARAAEARRTTGRPVVVITGLGHVEHDWGIERRLPAFDPEARVISVVPWRGQTAPDPAQADFFAYCPEPPAPSARKDAP